MGLFKSFPQILVHLHRICPGISVLGDDFLGSDFFLGEYARRYVCGEGHLSGYRTGHMGKRKNLVTNRTCVVPLVLTRQLNG